jgi:serine O-acetyltransferase
VLSTLRRDIGAIADRDPAARNILDTLLTYPGLHAVIAHRVAHGLWVRGHRFSARLVSALARAVTAVDIHPGATLGPGVFIDHATGVVIGETTIVGADVTIYQGVTLGGTSLRPGKRHPTLGDRVVVGAGAKVLGDITIGDDARIGANAVVVRDVPAGTVVVGVPGQVVARTATLERGQGVDMALDSSVDIVAARLSALVDRVGELEMQLAGRVSTRGPVESSDGVWDVDDFVI